MQPTNNTQQFKVRINHFIRVPQVRVILSDGSNGGIMDTRDALKLAQDENLDLIEINPKSTPPVCRIANQNKLRYEEKKKQQAAKKNQVIQELKEVTLRPGTDAHDIEHKLKQAKNFLAEGHRVKFTVRFRGREITHSELGRAKLEHIVQQLHELILPNPQVSLEGKFMSTIVSPVKTR
jgi:translation initiation factor IF-3